MQVNNDKSRIFFSGIAGSGVSALACFMADQGHNVAGSDRAFDLDPDHPLRQTFQSAGITIFPQDGSGLDQSFSLAVFSTAVEADRPEVVRAKALGVEIKTRPEFLTEITGQYRTIAVSGTSGKSTASGLLAFLMSKTGLSPNFIGGGRVKQFRTSSRPGNSLSGNSEYLVIEACESDGSIVNYRPRHSIILNLALDHHSVDVTAKMFETLEKNTSGKVFINADDNGLAPVINNDTVTFSINSPSMYKAADIRYAPFSTTFRLDNTAFTLSLPGAHNLYNALPCIALLAELGIPLKDIAAVLPAFQGIDRRFDIHLNDGKLLVIDDYAHNPHKISSLMETMKRTRPKVCYIFQPHGFAPTRMMKKEYIQAFKQHLRDTDHLILLPIYYAGGTAGKDISSHDLAGEIKNAGKSVEVIEERKTILNGINGHDTYVIFGARDESLSVFAEEMAGAVQKQDRNDR